MLPSSPLSAFYLEPTISLRIQQVHQTKYIAVHDAYIFSCLFLCCFSIVGRTPSMSCLQIINQTIFMPFSFFFDLFFFFLFPFFICNGPNGCVMWLAEDQVFAGLIMNSLCAAQCISQLNRREPICGLVFSQATIKQE